MQVDPQTERQKPEEGKKEKKKTGEVVNSAKKTCCHKVCNVCRRMMCFCD